MTFVLLLRRCMALALALCLGFSSALAQEVPELAEPVSVQLDTALARVETLSKIALYDASVVPYVEELCFQQEGTVSQVHVVIGQLVKAGDALITLDKTAESKQLETLNSQIEAKEQKAYYNGQLRSIDLSILQVELRKLQSQSTPDETAIALKELEIEELQLTMEMESAISELQLEGLRSKKAALEEKISGNTLYAPFDGRIVHMAELSRGSYISSYTPQIYLADDSRLYVRSAFISGAELSSAHSMEAIIGAKRYAITPVDVDPEQYVSTSVSGDTATTDFIIQQLDEDVTPGMYAAVCILQKQVENALVVPSNALYQGSDGRYLYVMEDGVRVRRDVKTGLTNNIMTQITHGLEEGEVVYVKE